jgi:hypothetical protein
LEPRDLELVQFAESVDDVVPLLAGCARDRVPDPDG